MTISVRIVNMDYCMSATGPLDRVSTPFSPTPLSKVPTVRIFGSTLGGQKICLHIHQVYPYFFVPYTIPPHCSTQEDIQKEIFQFGTNLNEAMNLAQPHGEKNHHIMALVLTKGVPFYGYHVGHQTFLKIYLVNPAQKQTMVDVLMSGALMGTPFQPHEAHINFELQFLMDYNLFGMDWIHLDDVEEIYQFRLPLANYPRAFDVKDAPLYTADTVDTQHTNTTPRESYSELELDITSMAILNRLDLVERDIHTQLHEPEVAKDKLVTSLQVIWQDELKRRKARDMDDPTIPPVSQTEPREPHVPWLAEPGLRKNMEKMMANHHVWEQDNSPLLDQVLTVFQAVEALHPVKQVAPSSSPQRTPINSQQGEYNVSATPTRYRDWNISSQLDPSIIQSFIRDPSFRQEEDEDEDEEDVNKQVDAHLDENEDDYFSQTDPLNNSVLAQWIEAQEDQFQYQPRQLNFENTSEPSPPPPPSPPPAASAVAKKRDIFDMEDMPFSISSLPPVPGPPGLNKKKRRRRLISQVDGPNDTHEPKKILTSADEWDLQRQRLKNMRRGMKNTTPMPKSKTIPTEKQKEENKARIEYIKKRCRKVEERFGKKPVKENVENEEKNKVPVMNKEEIVIQEEISVVNEKETHEEETTVHTVKAVQKELSMDTLPSIPSDDTNLPEMSTALVHEEHDPFSPLLEPTASSPTQFEYIYQPSPPEIHVPTTVVYREPFYSKPSDAPSYPTVFAGKEFKLPTTDTLKEFQSTFHASLDKKIGLEHTRIKQWTPAVDPPSYEHVAQWKQKTRVSSQLDEPTRDNTFDFKLSATKPNIEIKVDNDFIDYLSLEIHVNTRGTLLPDPQQDVVQVIFWCLQTKDRCFPYNGYSGYHVGIIALKSFDISKVGLSNTRAMIDYADTEEDLFSFLINRVRHFDPDMLVGYEVQNASWGYLVERGVELGIHLLDELSRIAMSTDSIKKSQWGYQKTSVYKVCGRHLLNIWRLMKGEITLTSYTFENVAYHLLHDRVPHYSHETLTTWYTKGPAVLKYRLFKYYLKRVQMNLDILDASQVVTRTCESARIFGVDFYSVLSRGSQYKVESIMFRIAKPENFVFVTPSRKQVASQRSLECLPLVMEPISQFYSSPMVVLDFQSLYPSIIIAYNYCYSTCLGRVRDLQESSRFGVQSQFDLQEGLLETFKDSINISPNGIMFVKPEIRKSLLAKMLAELLDTRVMIKRAMKDYKHDSGLLRMLDAKQLTLKLLANVTYGYTSASFSGRMPSVEIADSIVSTGRETLERAIKLINETEKWGARVVYGDTDSVFVYFPGKTKEEAFQLGHDIADTVTKLNPAPMKLKFEKVYHPAVLLAKKRYVGFKYEHPTDVEPVFEAKGIETVRRDGTAATQKILESCLKILFRTQDMSELKAYLYTQWTKILSNRVLLQEFIISKEVRMGTYSDRGGPSGAQIAQAGMDVDTRAEPQYGERVPYVVVSRGPKARLKDKVVRPEQVLADNTYILDAEYYIRKQIIPPLSRVFNLMGVDIESWYDSMPRTQKAEAMALATKDQPDKKISRIDQYYASSHCIVCRQITTDGSICQACRDKPYETIYQLSIREQQAQDRYRKILAICQDCSGLSPLDAMSVMEKEEGAYADIPCNSLDCPIYFERCKAKQDVKATSNNHVLLKSIYD